MAVGIGGGGEVGLPEAWDSFVLRAQVTEVSRRFPLSPISS